MPFLAKFPVISVMYNHLRPWIFGPTAEANRPNYLVRAAPYAVRQRRAYSIVKRKELHNRGRVVTGSLKLALQRCMDAYLIEKTDSIYTVLCLQLFREERMNFMV